MPLDEVFDRPGQNLRLAAYPFVAPVPPADREHVRDMVIGCPLADQPGRIAGNDRIGRHILRHHRACPDDSPVSDSDAWKHHGIPADPDIVADRDPGLAMR